MSESEDILAKQVIKGACAKLVFQIVVNIGIVIWEIFAIIALVNNPDDLIKSSCENSNLWVALLTTCIITGLNLLVNNKSRTDDNNDSNTVSNLSGCLGLGVFIWLCIEVFSDCAISNLRNNQVHIISYIYFWIVMGLSSVLFLIVMCGSCCLCLGMMNEKETQEDSFNIV